MPGSAESLILVVNDIDGARDEVVGRGVEVTEVFHDVGGVFHHARAEGRVTGPDGNGWLLQEIKTRLPGR